MLRSVRSLRAVFSAGLGLSVSVAACARETLPPRLALENAGKVCLDLDWKVAPPGAREASGRAWLLPDSLLMVTVFPEPAAPGSACVTAVAQSCSVQLTGVELRVESRFRFEPAGTEPCPLRAPI